MEAGRGNHSTFHPTKPLSLPNKELCKYDVHRDAVGRFRPDLDPIEEREAWG